MDNISFNNLIFKRHKGLSIFDFYVILKKYER